MPQSSTKLANTLYRSASLQPEFTNPFSEDNERASQPTLMSSLQNKPLDISELGQVCSPRSNGVKPLKKVKRIGPKDYGPRSSVASVDDENEKKPKRVRTGCLTCRERHLKCDENFPHCANCRKSSRVCKRGVKLNFMDIRSHTPIALAPGYGTPRWRVDFLDESQEIASEYEGGFERYQRLRRGGRVSSPAYADYPRDSVAQLSLPLWDSRHGSSVDHGYETPAVEPADFLLHTHHSLFLPHQQQYYSPQTQADFYALEDLSPTFDFNLGFDSIATDRSTFMDRFDTAHGTEKLPSRADSHLLEVFVKEVGVWMNNFDTRERQFARNIPFHALEYPMMLKAFVACGARHLTLVAPTRDGETTACTHYGDATADLRRQIFQPESMSKTASAVTAVVLSVYEFMSTGESKLARHVAGARELIRKCQWDATHPGAGGACFWLNVEMDVMSCMGYNRRVGRDPHDWGMGYVDFVDETDSFREDDWTRKMLYILARVCNLQASVHEWTQHRLRTHMAAENHQQTSELRSEFCALHAMCRAWRRGIPVSMIPMTAHESRQEEEGETHGSSSNFPALMLLIPAAKIGHLLWHNAMLILSTLQTLEGARLLAATTSDMPDLRHRRSHHSRMICGIVASTYERDISSVALRSLHHAAAALTIRVEQQEALDLVDTIGFKTGWKVDSIREDLLETWEWCE